MWSRCWRRLLRYGLLMHGLFPSSPSVGVPWPRVWAGTLAAMFTVFGTLMIRAAQPAALSTSLLVSLGVMQTMNDAGSILAAIAFDGLAGRAHPAFAHLLKAITISGEASADG